MNFIIELFDVHDYNVIYTIIDKFSKKRHYVFCIVDDENINIEIENVYSNLKSLFEFVKIFNFDIFDLQHLLFNSRFYLSIYLSLICIANQIFVIIFFSNRVTTSFIVSEYESKTFFDVFLSSSLKEK